MLDRVHARGDGHLGGAVAVAMGRDLAAPAMCFGDDGVHFFLGQLDVIHRIGERQHAARGHELDDVGAVLDLIAHRRAALIGTAAHALDGTCHGDALRRHRVLIGMPARRSNRIVGHQHARARNLSGVDGIAQAECKIVGRPEVAHRGNARLERRLGIVRAVQHLLGGESHDAVEPIAIPVWAGLLRQMHMRIDEPRQQSGIAQIDHLRILGNLEVAAHRLDFGAGNDHHAVRDQLAGHGIEQTRRLQRDGSRRSRNCIREARLHQEVRESNCRNPE